MDGATGANGGRNACIVLVYKSVKYIMCDIDCSANLCHFATYVAMMRADEVHIA